MAYISVTNALNDNSATSDITLVGTNFTDITNGLSDGTKDINVAGVAATSVASSGAVSGTTGTFTGAVSVASISATTSVASATVSATGKIQGQLSASTEQAKTLASDAFAMTAGKNVYYLTSQSGTSDDLATITQTGEGDLIIIRADNTHTITVKNGTGNIYCGADRVLNSIRDTMVLLYINGGWLMLSYADNA